MRTAKMTLLSCDDEGSTSRLVADSEAEWLIEELPDRANARNKSRVNASLAEGYLMEWDESPAHGWCYHMRGVNGHDHVLLHIGNLAGDIALGFASDSEACLLPGITRTLFRRGEKVGRHVLTRDQHGVSGSGIALKAIEDEFRREPFRLIITR